MSSDYRRRREATALCPVQVSPRLADNGLCGFTLEVASGIGKVLIDSLAISGSILGAAAARVGRNTSRGTLYELCRVEGDTSRLARQDPPPWEHRESRS